MSYKQTWFWLFVAGVLAALILVLRPYAPKAPIGPQLILPNLRTNEITSVRVRPSGPMPFEIRADRTNGSWQLIQPVSYPAETTNILNLLAALARLTPATFITPAEFRNRPKADEEYGFAAPQASVTLWSGEDHTQVLFGSRTVPGDEVFLEVVGLEGAYVVDANILKLVPRSADDWRDTSVLDVAQLVFDRLTVANNGKAFVLQRDAPDRPWRIVSPSTSRAHSARISAGLEKLQDLRVRKFVPEDSQTDGEALGLAPADLELSFAQGTNVVAALQFGKSPTNDAKLVYARRSGQKTIFTVPAEPLSVWRLSLNDFRDPYLLVVDNNVEQIAVHGQDNFLLQRQADQTWRIQGQQFPIDNTFVSEFFSDLTNLEVVQFTQDAVTPGDLPAYGLAKPVLEYVLSPAPTTAGPGLTNGLTVSFGLSTNQPDKVFARRADESSIYAINSNQFTRLPSASWQFRDRHPWRLNENDIAGVRIQQQGKERKLLRRGPGEWSLAPGSSGIIDPLAVEATVSDLANLSANWLGRGEQFRPTLGLTNGCREVTLESRSGAKTRLQFGLEAPTSDQYAAVTIDDQLWIFLCPWRLYRDIQLYLSVP